MLETLVVLAISAAGLGIIIAVMEEDDFPGWGRMVLCVLVTSVAAGVGGWLAPVGSFLMGPLIGAAVGGLVISATCGMSYRRAFLAAGIYLALQLALGFAVAALLS